jgi:ubiquinone/menaquinone biosynthesis C-methylase UbiE
MTAKAYKGLGMEGRVARWYAKTTRQDLGEFQALAQRMAEDLPVDARVLEVAPGPGYLSIELAKRGRRSVTGLDISKTFVEIARRNAEKEGVQVDFQLGNASRMPFEDASFDLIVCRAAFKNFSAPVAALREMRRVLRPGGKAMVIDLRKDAPLEAIDAYVAKMHTNAVNATIIRWTFRLMLLKRAYTESDFRSFISESGFEKYDMQEAPLGLEIALFK